MYRPRSAASAVLVAFVLALAGCGSSENASTAKEGGNQAAAEPAKEAAPELPVFTQENVAELASATETDDVKGAEVKRIAGQVFNVERGADGIAVQMHTDPENGEGTVILLLEPGAKIKDDDYVRASGTVYDIFEGENAFGAELTLPRIEVTSWKPVSASALDPAIKTYKSPQTRDLSGVQITVQRVEISENETRIKVRYQNNSGEEFLGSASLVADGEEIETAYNDGNKEPADDVSPGASTSGILTFDAVDPDAKLVLKYNGYDYDYNDIAVSFTFGK
jgi:hypothetical protein